MSRRLLAVGVLMVLMSVGLSILPAGADEKPAPNRLLVSDGIIQGNQRTSTEQIKTRLHKQAGKEYDLAAFDEDVRKMYKMTLFSNIWTFMEPDGAGKVKVYFTLPDQVQKVTFLGAKHIKEEELLKETGVRCGMSLNPKLNEEGCQKILNKYEEQGRSFASCTLVKGGQLGDREVVYQITEGPKVKVRDIQFTGNTFVSGARLAKQIKSSGKWFHVLGGNYNSKKAEVDAHEVEKYFKKFGYHDVKVSLEVLRSANGGEVTLIFHIQEEARQNAHTRRIKEYYGYTDRDVQVQHVYLWSQDTSGISPVQYETEEHPEARCSPPFKINKSPTARIGQILITGNKRISSESILAHVSLCPGGILTYPDLKEAEKTLAELDLFVVDPETGVHPTITVIDRGDDSVYKDLRITVQEKKTKRTSGKSK